MRLPLVHDQRTLRPGPLDRILSQFSATSMVSPVKKKDMQFGIAASLDDGLDACDGFAFKLDQIRLLISCGIVIEFHHCQG